MPRPGAASLSPRLPAAPARNRNSLYAVDVCSGPSRRAVPVASLRAMRHNNDMDQPSSKLRLAAMVATVVALLAISVPFVWQHDVDAEPAAAGMMTPIVVASARRVGAIARRAGRRRRVHGRRQAGEARFHDEGSRRQGCVADVVQGQGHPAELLGNVVRSVQGGDPRLRRTAKGQSKNDLVVDRLLGG